MYLACESIQNIMIVSFSYNFSIILSRNSCINVGIILPQVRKNAGAVQRKARKNARRGD